MARLYLPVSRFWNQSPSIRRVSMSVATIFQVEEVFGLIGTLAFWFFLIVVVALVIGAATWFLRIYFLTTLIGGMGPRRQPEVGKQCPNCRGYSPQDSKFCKNCGGRF